MLNFKPIIYVYAHVLNICNIGRLALTANIAKIQKLPEIKVIYSKMHIHIYVIYILRMHIGVQF